MTEELSAPPAEAGSFFQATISERLAQRIGEHTDALAHLRTRDPRIEQRLRLEEQRRREPMPLTRRPGGAKKPFAPKSRKVLHARFTVMSGTPKAREIWDCEARPLAMSCEVKKRNEAMSSGACEKTGRWPLK